MITVVSGFSPEGRIEYGDQFMRTFDRFWPADVRLQVYVEELTPVPRGGERSLWRCSGMHDFIERHHRDPRKTGRKPVTGWRPKHRDRGYCYRFDAVKFSRQCFIPEQAATEMADGDILVWLDGDVVTHKPVAPGMVEGLLGDADVCYLGRKNFHCELGFWAMRLNAETRRFLSEWAELWRSDRVFRLSEWHSAFTFEFMLGRFGTLNKRNLTPEGTGHVWFQCEPLAASLDHLKGSTRKRKGRSPERVA